MKRIIWSGVATLTVSAALLVILDSPRIAQAGSCCRVTVEGCGKTANVCMAKDCNNATYAEARKMFESAHKCSSSKMRSSIGTCSGQKCDIDLR